jgi:ribulose-5-phosphate 4-epimerase/fuculose-1-phosphate aldolase
MPAGKTSSTVATRWAMPCRCTDPDRARGAAVATTMGGRPVVLLRGHGLAAAGASVPEAVLRAISVDTIAGLALTVVAAGGRLDIPDDDWADLPDLGPGFMEGVGWRHELARLGEPG